MSYYMAPKGSPFDDALWDIVHIPSGRVVLKDESYNVASGILWHLNNTGKWTCSEVCQVAEAIEQAEAASDSEDV